MYYILSKSWAKKKIEEYKRSKGWTLKKKKKKEEEKKAKKKVNTEQKASKSEAKKKKQCICDHCWLH